MKKSIGSFFLALVFLTVLLGGCAPASTPIPPTPTPTIIPTPTLSVEEIFAAAVQTACQQQPAASEQVGTSIEGQGGAQLCPDSESGLSLPQVWIAKTPGNLRFVVAIHSGSFSGACGPYTADGQPPAAGETGTLAQKMRQFTSIRLIDARTGAVIDSTRLVGPDVSCPYQITVGEDIMGEAVTKEAIQAAVVDLLSKPIHFARRTLESSTNDINSLVSSVAFSPDGKLLASGAAWLAAGSYGNTVNLWDVASGQEVRSLAGHTNGVTSVAFAPDGKLLASGSYDNTVKLWDVASGQEVHTLEGHTDIITSVAFSPDGKLLASGSYDNTVKIWDVVSGQEVRTLEGHTQLVTSVAFSPDGKLLASASQDSTVKLWDVASGDEVRTLQGKDDVYNFISSVAFSPDGKLLATGSEYGTVKIWDLASGKELRTLDVKDDVNSVGFSPDGKLLATGPVDNGDGPAVKLWDVSSGDLVSAFDGYSGAVVSDGALEPSGAYNLVNVAFSPDGSLLASSAGAAVILWNIKEP